MRPVLGLLVLVFALPIYSADGSYHWDLPKGFPVPRVPPNNPMSIDKVKLGRYLFYDKRLSGNGTMSCASCHRRELAFTDGRAFPTGVTGQAHPRSAMTVVNAAYNSVLTWSNPEIRTLEQQIMIPLFSVHPVELGLRGHESTALAAFRSDAVYRDLFPRAFPGTDEAFTMANIAKALACFVRTMISGHSPYDRFAYGQEENAISESAKRGELLFFTAGAGTCFRCHGGFNFSDASQPFEGRDSPVKFHNTGLYNLPGLSSYPEPNRGIYEHTHRPSDMGKFKAPTLRNIAVTAPYMHDGSLKTLEDVLDHYVAGGRTRNPNKDPMLQPFALSPQNRLDMIAFLESLTDTELLHDIRFSDPW